MIHLLLSAGVACLLLVLGDFISTFCFHIPEHVFGSLHLRTHHSGQKSFRHYAVLSLDYGVLLDGILGALPYLFLGVILWHLSPIGVVIGLILGQLHVWWRHVSALKWQTPPVIIRLCEIFFITTPERHWQHHLKTSTAFGDIFTFFEYPAKMWLCWLRVRRSHLRTKRFGIS